MSILTEDDVIALAPSISLRGAALSAAIAQVQAEIEGYRGANRRLEVTEYKSIYRILTRSQSFHLDYSPVVGTPTLRGRFGNIRDRYGSQTGLSDWIEIARDDFILDGDGFVTLNRSGFAGNSSFFSSSFRGSSVSSIFTEVEVTYLAGFDFSTDTPEIQAIKASAIAVLNYQLNSPAYSGIAEEDIDEEYKVRYFSPGKASGIVAGQVPEGLLQPFWKYKAIGGMGLRA